MAVDIQDTQSSLPILFANGTKGGMHHIVKHIICFLLTVKNKVRLVPDKLQNRGN